MKDYSSGHDLADKGIAFVQASRNDSRRANNQVERKRRRTFHADLNGLFALVASRHHDKKVDVAVDRGPAMGVGSEEDDPFGPKLFRDSADVPPDDGKRNEIHLLGIGAHDFILTRHRKAARRPSSQVI